MDIDIVKILLAAFGGILLGFEREYKFKSAGIRTIPLITMGSCIFTTLSYDMGAPNSPDRIASNILTGIGFIGAGVIFRQNLSVSGITTAATIWVAAAAGMAIGLDRYVYAFAIIAIALFVLIFLRYLQENITSHHQIKVYTILLKDRDAPQEPIISIFTKLNLNSQNSKTTISEHDCEYQYTLKGKESDFKSLNRELLKLSQIKGFTT